MGKSKSLELPPTPTQYTNPLQQGDISYQSGLGHDLTSGNLPSWLQSTINPNNSANALSYAQGLLAPQFRNNIQDITNQAVANNQNTSSTYTDALAKASGDTNSAYQSILAQQAINDSNQANSNKLNLFGSGLNTLQQGIGNEQQDSGATNSFNLENYQNQVAKAIQNNQNANKANGWQQLLGMVSPIGHDYLQSTGINSVPGYGVADIAKIGSTFMGFGGIGGQGGALGPQLNTGGSAPFAGAYAGASGNNLGLSGGYGQFAQQQNNPFALGGRGLYG